MSARQQLDEFVPAYTPEFKFALDNELLKKAYVALIEKRIRAHRTDRLLSLGIGDRIVPGRLLKFLEEGLVANYTLIEGSQKLIETFRSEFKPAGGGVDVVKTWFEEYEPRERFDAIEMGFVLEHVEDPALILSRFKEFLNPGGTLFVAVPNARSLHRLLGHAAGMLPNIYQLSEHDHQFGHRRYFDASYLRKIVEHAGYEIQCLHGLVLKPFSTQQLLDLSLPPAIWEAFVDLGYELPDLANGVYVAATH